MICWNKFGSWSGDWGCSQVLLIMEQWWTQEAERGKRLKGLALRGLGVEEGLGRISNSGVKSQSKDLKICFRRSQRFSSHRIMVTAVHVRVLARKRLSLDSSVEKTLTKGLFAKPCAGLRKQVREGGETELALVGNCYHS